jgi:hypothetical protein
MLSSNAVFVVVCVAAVLLIGLVCVMYAAVRILISWSAPIWRRLRGICK